MDRRAGRLLASVGFALTAAFTPGCTLDSGVSNQIGVVKADCKSKPGSPSYIFPDWLIARPSGVLFPDREIPVEIKMGAEVINYPDASQPDKEYPRVKAVDGGFHDFGKTSCELVRITKVNK